MQKLLIIILVFCFNSAFGQFSNRYNSIREKLDSLSVEEPGLLEAVEISVSELAIQEFLSAISKAHKLNVSVSTKINAEVSNDFSDAKVLDVFVYVCKEYNLDIDIEGAIISFFPYEAPKKEPIKLEARKLNISFAQSTQFLSIDLKNDTLADVVKEITSVSGINVILAPGLDNKLVSAYIQNRPIENTLEKLAFANGMELKKSSDSFFILSEAEIIKSPSAATVKTNRSKDVSTMGDMEANIEVVGNLISVSAENQPIKTLIKVVSGKLNKNFFLFNEPEGNATLFVENATYEDFMTYLLNGTEYTHKVEEGIYLIGKRQLERLRATDLIQLQNRTIESVSEVIPTEIKKGLEIKEFVELNAFVVTGSYPNVREVKTFLQSIDKVVPVVLIDVLIVNVSNNKGISTGVSAGFGENPDPGTNRVTPDFSMDVDPNRLLDLISGISSAGAFNLGHVAPDFYLSVKALESNGFLKTNSTPKLATINGHEANTTIGTTEYYLETSNNVIGTQNPQNIQTRSYKSVSADLSITIKPIVSGDEQVTLEIEVSQSDFTEKFEPGAPPGSVTRKFNSVIRVKNEEMILLGGLEEKSVSESGRGFPFLSRIPILKFFFGQQERSKSKSKLHIFIKPTVIY
ncbi:MAG: hypothetical protein KDC83_06690 [Flavobacteriales bacterium]|nr:hypothetical protein [Flavobacteriales bacterium]